MIRIGIVGCGRILAAHLRGYRLLRQAGYDDFRITALCARRAEDARAYVDRDPRWPQRPAVSRLEGDPLAVGDETLADFQSPSDVWITDDYRQLVTSDRVDAVNDLTPHSLHHQVSGLALAHGKHVLTQKPLAITVAAGRQLLRLAESRQVVFGVFENFRFTPLTRHLRWALATERLGPLELALFGYVGAWWAPRQIVAETPWRHRRSEGGGISLDLGVHFFDQLRFVAGEIESVEARVATLEPVRQTPAHGDQPSQTTPCDADDTCLAQFRLCGGALGTLSASWAGAGGGTYWGPGSVYYGAGGRLADGLAHLADGQTRRLDEWFADEAPADLRQGWFPSGLSDSFALAQHDWLEAIRHRRPPETDGHEGLADLAAAYAILESAELGGSVRVADVLDGTAQRFQSPLNEAFGIIGLRR